MLKLLGLMLAFTFSMPLIAVADDDEPEQLLQEVAAKEERIVEKCSCACTGTERKDDHYILVNVRPSESCSSVCGRRNAKVQGGDGHRRCSKTSLGDPDYFD
jgi:hypothetical protein